MDDDIDLTAKDRKVLAEVRQKGYYHGMLGQERTTAPQGAPTPDDAVHDESPQLLKVAAPSYLLEPRQDPSWAEKRYEAIKELDAPLRGAY